MAVDALLAVPGVISFVLVLVVFWLHGRIVSTRAVGGCKGWPSTEEPGDFAWLQFWTCVAAFISVLGGCVESLGFYDSSNGEEDVGAWCQFEAICSSFGELAVILWVISSCIYLYAQLKEKLSSSETRRRMFVYFHLCVWSIALLMTVIPASQGFLGLHTNSDQSEAWCWFKPGHRDWEWAQFYAPLLAYVVISLVAFIACIRVIRTRLSAPPLPTANTLPTTNTVQSPRPVLTINSSSTNSNNFSTTRVVENEGVLYVRMAWQFGVLFVVYVPDLIAVLVDEDTPRGAASFHSASRSAEFLWRCEGLALATMYLLNGRVRTLATQLPEIQWLTRRGSNPLSGIIDSNDVPLPTIHTPSDLRPKGPLIAPTTTHPESEYPLQSDPLPTSIEHLDNEADCEADCDADCHDCTD